MLLFKKSQNILHILQPLFPAYPFNYFMAMPFMSNLVILKFIIIKTLLHVTSYFYTDIYFLYLWLKLLDIEAMTWWMNILIQNFYGFREDLESAGLRQNVRIWWCKLWNTQKHFHLVLCKSTSFFSISITTTPLNVTKAKANKLNWGGKTIMASDFI